MKKLKQFLSHLNDSLEQSDHLSASLYVRQAHCLDD